MFDKTPSFRGMIAPNGGRLSHSPSKYRYRMPGTMSESAAEGVGTTFVNVADEASLTGLAPRKQRAEMVVVPRMPIGPVRRAEAAVGTVPSSE